jgi:hypothetical protein
MRAGPANVVRIGAVLGALGALLLFSGLTGFPRDATGATFTSTIPAVEDTFVRSDRPDRNYGYAPTLQADSYPSVKRALIRFHVAELPEGAIVTSARLRLFVVNYSRTGGTVHTVEGIWSEDAVTWANAPAVGGAVAKLSGPAVVGTWVEADLTAAITGNGDVDFYLVTSSADAVYYSSADAGVNPPTLIVQWSGASPSPTPTPTAAPAPTPTATPAPVDGRFQPEPPITAAFFYPWFPNAWRQSGIYPYTNFTPTLGFYDSTDDAIIDEQLRLAARSHIEAFISSWWGQGHHTDIAFRHILDRSARSDSPDPGMRWALYYEPEGYGDPAVYQIVDDLQYFADSYFSNQGYLKVDGRPVVFVWAEAADGPAMADRWARAKAQFGGQVYVVLKVYSGYASDPNQPDSWHQYGPAASYDEQLPYSVTVSPGFWKSGEAPRLVRDPARFESDVQRMAASGAFWQLVTTWNEWGEGTSVEPAAEFGDAYIGILCRNLPGPSDCGQGAPAPTPTATPAPTPSPVSPPSGGSLAFTAGEDTFVKSTRPGSNYGHRPTLEADNYPYVKRTLLRFQVSGIPEGASVASATLRLFVVDPSDHAGTVRAVLGAWSEANTTWSNAPAVGSVVADVSRRAEVGTWVDADVTSAVVGNGSFDFYVVTPSDNGVDFSSRERGDGNPPTLVVEWSGSASFPAPEPAPTPTPTPAPAPTPTPAPAPTPPPVGSFSFSAAGDHGAVSSTDASLRAIASDSGILFHLVLGDLSYSDRTPESAWCDYVRGFLGGTFPAEVLVGNHEEDSRVDGFIRNFAACLPDRLGSVGDYGVQYYFDYPAGQPLARFIMIAADLSVDGTHYDYNSGARADWLRARIREAKAQGLWTIVGTHKNCLTIGIKPCEIGQALTNLLIEEGADLVLQGHDHDYQRSHALALGPGCTAVPAGSFDADCVADNGSDGRYVRGAGTVFVINGNFGGGGFYTIDTSDPEKGYFSAWNGSNVTNPAGFTPARGFVRYTVTADRIEAAFVPTSGGDYTDSFVIR